MHEEGKGYTSILTWFSVLRHFTPELELTCAGDYSKA